MKAILGPLFLLHALGAAFAVWAYLGLIFNPIMATPAPDSPWATAGGRFFINIPDLILTVVAVAIGVLLGVIHFRKSLAARTRNRLCLSASIGYLTLSASIAWFEITNEWFHPLALIWPLVFLLLSSVLLHCGLAQERPEEDEADD